MRDLENPPKFYEKLNGKQKRNWRYRTRKVNKNDELRDTLPLFRSSTDFSIVYLNHQTDPSTIDTLINEAMLTSRYTIDTEGDGKRKDVLIQIEFVHSTNRSTVILIEAWHLPEPHSVLFGKIKELCTIIFNSSNHFICWGSAKKELKEFDHFGLFISENVKNETNMQFKFKNWHNRVVTHPARES